MTLIGMGLGHRSIWDGDGDSDGMMGLGVRMLTGMVKGNRWDGGCDGDGKGKGNGKSDGDGHGAMKCD